MDKDSFEIRVRETLRNAAGQRGLSDHLRRLKPEIAALRVDGVGWVWIAGVLGEIRGEPKRCSDHTIRTLWSRLGLNGAASGQAASAEGLVIGPQALANRAARNDGEPASAISRMKARQSRSLWTRPGGRGRSTR